MPLYSMMRYHLGWVDEQGKPQQPGGKGLRPLLCLLELLPSIKKASLTPLRLPK